VAGGDRLLLLVVCSLVIQGDRCLG
jgi:hypothetical protein